MISEKDIESIFEEQLKRIKNHALREQVIATWKLGCKKGGWSQVDQIVKMPFTLLSESYGIGFVEHTIVVTEGAVGLAQAQEKYCRKLPYSIDYDRLIAGGLLHDVGKLLEIEPDGKGGYRKSVSGKYARHPISGAILAAQCGLSEDILNIIACHSKEGEGKPQVLETVLIHQADFASFDPLTMKQKGLLIEKE